MMRVDAYPILGGLEVSVALFCHQSGEGHEGHRGARFSMRVEQDELDAYGPERATLRALGFMLADNPGASELIECGTGLGAVSAGTH